MDDLFKLISSSMPFVSIVCVFVIFIPLNGPNFVIVVGTCKFNYPICSMSSRRKRIGRIRKKSHSGEHNDSKDNDIAAIHKV